jgi:hypothetical protein
LSTGANHSSLKMVFSGRAAARTLSLSDTCTVHAGRAGRLGGLPDPRKFLHVRAK